MRHSTNATIVYSLRGLGARIRKLTDGLQPLGGYWVSLRTCLQPSPFDGTLQLAATFGIGDAAYLSSG
jgi:hypothetical protein